MTTWCYRSVNMIVVHVAAVVIFYG